MVFRTHHHFLTSEGCLPLVLAASVMFDDMATLTEMGSSSENQSIDNPTLIYFAVRQQKWPAGKDRAECGMSSCFFLYPWYLYTELTANMGLIGWMNVVMVHLLNLGGLQTWVPNTLAI